MDIYIKNRRVMLGSNYLVVMDKETFVLLTKMSVHNSKPWNPFDKLKLLGKKRYKMPTFFYRTDPDLFRFYGSF